MREAICLRQTGIHIIWRQFESTSVSKLVVSLLLHITFIPIRRKLSLIFIIVQSLIILKVIPVGLVAWIFKISWTRWLRFCLIWILHLQSHGNYQVAHHWHCTSIWAFANRFRSLQSLVLHHTVRHPAFFLFGLEPPCFFSTSAFNVVMVEISICKEGIIIMLHF